MSRLVICFCVYLLCILVAPVSCGSAAFGQTEPTAGSEATPFKVFGVTGAIADKDATLCEAPVKHPQVFFFVAADRFDRPMARYLTTVDEKARKGSDGFKDIDLFGVWLTDNPRQSRTYLPKAQQSLRLGLLSLAVLDGGAQGPNGWGIDSTAHLTAVIVRDGKIVDSFVYRSINDKDVAELAAALQKSEPPS